MAAARSRSMETNSSGLSIRRVVSTSTIPGSLTVRSRIRSLNDASSAISGPVIEKSISTFGPCRSEVKFLIEARMSGIAFNIVRISTIFSCWLKFPSKAWLGAPLRIP